MTKRKRRQQKTEMMMSRVRAARAAIDCYPPCKAREEAELEAFMSIFHPEKSANRAYMAKLKGNCFGV